MQDEETGSWWQQVSGEAVFGSLKGKRLEPIEWDEISFGLWEREHPLGLVLKDADEQRKHYAPENWETRILRHPTVFVQGANEPLRARDLIIGLEWSGIARAYLFESVEKENPVTDVVGSLPLLLAVDRDGKSVRCFDRRLDGQTYDFFLKPDRASLILIDSQTGSEWDFSGKAITGIMLGKTLRHIQVLKDFWFDWKLYHPLTTLYSGT